MSNFSVEPNPNVRFEVRHEDEDLIVVEKPAGIVTQPGLGHEDDALLNGVFARHGHALQNLGKARDFGLLHRLDRETSGLVIIALRGHAYDALREQFATRQIRKYYWAVTVVPPRDQRAVIRKPIAEYESRGKKLARISGAGKQAVTAYRVIQSSNQGSLCECRAVTGRLHQIRVHLASIGCPIVGDGFYGRDIQTSLRSRLALHAHRLVFPHPMTGALVDVGTEWPSDLAGLLIRMKIRKPKPTDRVDTEEPGPADPPEDE